MEPRKFTIIDDCGDSHAYEVITHSPEKGLALTFRILELLGPTLGKAITGFLQGKDRASIMDSEMDGEAIGAAVEALAVSLVKQNAVGLIKELLSNATRDGQALDNPAHFSVAYQANYGELSEAMVRVIIENGFHRFLSRLLLKTGLLRKIALHIG